MVLEHIKNLQNARGSVRPLFLVSEHIIEEKSEWLNERLETVKRENFSDGYIFKVLDTLSEKDFSMAVLSVENVHNPLYYETLSVPFCLTENVWKAAPLFGSFSLTGRGMYDLQERAVCERLELWAKQKSTQLKKLGKRNNLEELEKKKDEFCAVGMPLRDGSKEDAVRFFFERCQSKDSVGILSCSDIDREILCAGLMADDSALSQLLNHDYLFTVIGGVEDAVYAAIYFPLARQKPNVFKFQVKKRASCWELVLPNCLGFSEEGKLNTDFFEVIEDQKEIEHYSDQLKGLMAKSIKHAHITSETSAITHLINVLSVGNFQEFMCLFDFSVEGEDVSDVEQLEMIEKQFNAVCKLWKSLQSKNSQKYLNMYTDSGDDFTLNVLASYSPAHPTQVKVHSFAFRKREGIWLLIPPNKSLKSMVGEERWAKLESSKKDAPEQCQKQLFADIPRDSGENGISFDAEDKASLKRFADAYLASLADRDLHKSIVFHTYEEGSQRDVLRSIGNDFRSVKSRVSSLKVKDVLICDKVAFLVFCVEFGEKVESSYFAYPVIQVAGTSQKLSILSHYLYRFEHGRGEKIQNASMLEKMKATRDLTFSENYLTLIDEFNDFVKSQMNRKDTK